MLLVLKHWTLYLAFLLLLQVYNMKLVAYFLLKTPWISYPITHLHATQGRSPCPALGVDSDESKLDYGSVLPVKDLQIGMYMTHFWSIILHDNFLDKVLPSSLRKLGESLFCKTYSRKRIVMLPTGSYSARIREIIKVGRVDGQTALERTRSFKKLLGHQINQSWGPIPALHYLLYELIHFLIV